MLPSQIATAFSLAAAKYLMKYGNEAVEKMLQDPSEVKKHCGVCGERIKGGAEFGLSKRFYCIVCGHRTHRHCAGDRSKKICARCQSR